MPHAEATVDGNDGPVYIPRLLRAEEGHGGGDLLGGAEPTQSGEPGQLLFALVGQGVEHGRGDRPGSDQVAGDVAGGELPGYGAGEPDEARLGGSVVGLTGGSRRARGRAHADDAP